jgi:hypothetical protein
MSNFQVVNNPYEQTEGMPPQFQQPQAQFQQPQPQFQAPQPYQGSAYVPPVQQPQFQPQPQYNAPVGPATTAPPPVPQAPKAEAVMDVDRKQLIELPTQSGQALDALNLVMMTGYFHHMRKPDGSIRFSEKEGSARLGFHIAEKLNWTSKEGQVITKVVWHRAQAWNDFARVLTQVIDGTPIKIWGNLTLYYLRDDSGNLTGSLVDIKVNKFEFP